MKKIFFVFFLIFSFTAFSSPEIIFVDVREAEEVKDGMLDKAVWYPLSKLQKDLSWKDEFIKITKDKEIHLYCRSGKRAALAQEILKKVGLESKNIGGYEELRKKRSE